MRERVHARLSFGNDSASGCLLHLLRAADTSSLQWFLFGGGGSRGSTVSIGRNVVNLEGFKVRIALSCVLEFP